jgi:hypothetical protein
LSVVEPAILTLATDGFALFEDDKVAQLLGELELGQPLATVPLVKKT